MNKRLKLQSLLILLPFLCCACLGSLMGKKPQFDFHEQLYIDGRLNFTINHPLNWERIEIPVSSPNYQNDTVLWRIRDPELPNTKLLGEMRIRSYPVNRQLDLAERLRDFLPSNVQPNLTQAESFPHPSGNAISLSWQDELSGWLIVAIGGQQHDFLLSISFPPPRFDPLLPVFKDIIQSFHEVTVDKTDLGNKR